ncbi:hypothetical protein ACE1CD_26370 [Aerosakkonema sp. BLCC-F183]|uniref:hypothetical protein n=1 Tax=Aerosakkonema sp. BLCC-F183 TaxID=3342834 RepID=UPI0035BA3FA7
MSKLLNFLTDIAINPKQQIAFAQQPKTVTDAFGLSEMDKALIESKSRTKITAFFADNLTPLAEICNDPNPEDPFPDPDPEPEPEPSKEN